MIDLREPRPRQSIYEWLAVVAAGALLAVLMFGGGLLMALMGFPG